MNTAAKGRRLEHKSIKIYRAEGFWCIRAAGSKGAWDFVAVKGNAFHLVQVKSGDWPSKAEIREMKRTPQSAWATRVLHRWKPRAKAPDVRYI